MFCVSSVDKICQSLIWELENYGNIALPSHGTLKRLEIDVFHAALQLINRWFFFKSMWILCRKLPKDSVFIISEFTCAKHWFSDLHLTKGVTGSTCLMNHGGGLKYEKGGIQVLKKELPEMLLWMEKQKWMSVEQWKTDPMFSKDLEIWRCDAYFNEKRRYVRKLISETEYKFWFTLNRANELFPALKFIHVREGWIVIDKKELSELRSCDRQKRIARTELL